MTTQSYAYTPGPQGEFAHRPIVWGTRGMVGGGTQLTAQTGMRILWQGGNAVDAAVAAAFAAGVLEPSAHYSLGGEVACLFYDRSSQQMRSVVGQGWAPRPRPWTTTACRGACRRPIVQGICSPAAWAHRSQPGPGGVSTGRPPEDAGRGARLSAAANDVESRVCRGRRGRHHVPGHGGRTGEHGLGHAQQFRGPDPGDDSGRHRYPDQLPGVLLLAGPGQPQRPGASQAAAHNAVHLHRTEAGPALHDARDPRRRQPAAELPASVYQHGRLWVKRAGGGRGATVLWLELSAITLAPSHLSQPARGRGPVLPGAGRGAQRQGPPCRSRAVFPERKRRTRYSNSSRVVQT